MVLRNNKLIGNALVLPDGSFEVNGLEPGPVSLLAIARAAESDEVSYLAAEDDPAIAQILLQEFVDVNCQLLSEDGAPVAGAVVRYRAAGARRRQAISDPAGSFSLQIPQDTQSLLAVIVAAGFPVTLRQLDPQSPEMQRIILGTASASLHIVPRGTGWPFVTLDGQAFLSITSLLGLPSPDGRRGMVDDGIQVPIAPGVYTICSASRLDGACQSARVAAGHEQTITMGGTDSK